MKTKITLLLLGLLIPIMCFSQWTQLGSTLEGITDEDGLWFGYDVALSADGSTIVTGAPFSTGVGLHENNSYVEVYRYIDGDWQLLGNKIEGADHIINNMITPHAGQSVAISHDGNTIAIGETGYYTVYEDELTPQNGRVRIFEYINGSWEQVGEDIISGAFVDDNGNLIYESGHYYFGTAVALSADASIVAIGNYDVDDYANGTNYGEVRIFENVNGEWQTLGNTVYGAINGGDSDKFGISIDLSSDGMVLAVGAPEGEGDTPGPNDPGYVNIYEYQTNDWQLIGHIEGLESDDGWGRGNWAGSSVALSDDGTIVAFSGSQYRNSDDEFVGNVRVFKNNAGTWQQVGDMLEGAKSSHVNTKSMVDISADGNILAFGTGSSFSWPPSSSSLGNVQVYQNVNDEWQQINDTILPVSSEEENDFGQVVSLSADGSAIALGIFGATVDDINGVGIAKVYQDCALANISILPEDTEGLCDGENTTLSAIIAQEYYQERGIINWYEEETATEPFYNSSSYETPELTETSSYWVEAVTPTGCPSEREEVTVIVNPIPELAIENTVIDVCQGASAQLSAVTDIGMVNWYDSEASTTPVFTGTEVTTPVLNAEVTYWAEAISEEGCNSERIAVDILVNENIAPVVEFSYDPSYCPDGNMALPVLAEDFYPGGEFKSTSGIVLDAITGEIDVANSNPGIYVISYEVAEDLEVCITAKSFEQEVIIRPCFVQRGISPNGDGLNDTFDLRGIQAQKVNIFNRYGTKVYSFNGNYTDQWDGRDNNGKQLPDATYFYTIFTKNGEKLTGWVYINKQF